MSTKFDFDSFNKLTNDIAPGLKVALAESLLTSALWSLERFNNPLSDELLGVRTELKTFRAKYKARQEERANKLASEEAAEDIDNMKKMKEHSTSADNGRIS